jgi:serine/threonine protein kinase
MEKVIDGRFRIRSLIGEGNFGKVFSARDLKTRSQVAVKLETITKYSSQLDHEAEVLKHIQGGTGIPKYIASGQWNCYKYLALQLLGNSLHDIFLQHHKHFSLHSIISLAEQILDRIEYLHNKNYLHRDIKPRQFLAGRGSEIDKIFMIDFGLAKKYQTGEMGLHIPYLENRPFVGTAYYASLNVHLGIQQGRRDDLESYVYMLSYLCRGKLPWMDIPSGEQSELKIRLMKSGTTSDQLFVGGPVEFMSLFSYVRSLQFESKPDYEYIRYLFRSIRLRENIMLHMLDWKYASISRKPKGKDPKTNSKTDKQKPASIRTVKTIKKSLNESAAQSTKNEINPHLISMPDLLHFKSANSLIVEKTCEVSDFGASHEELLSLPSIHNVAQSPTDQGNELSGTIKLSKYPEIKDRKILAGCYSRKRSHTIATLGKMEPALSDVYENSCNKRSRSHKAGNRETRRGLTVPDVID